MKNFVLLAAVAAASFVFWLLIKPVFHQSLLETRIWLWPLVAMIILAGLTALVYSLLSPRLTWLAVALNLIIFAVLFNPLQPVIWLGAGIALLFQLSARQAIAGESQNRVRFNLRSTLHSGMGRLVTSLLILISFAYFLNSGIREAAERQELPSGVRTTVQVIVGNYIGESLEKQNPRLRAQATEQVLNQITNFLKPYFIFLPPVLAFGLFLILQGLSFIFVWLGIIFAWLVFHILKILKLVKIETETREVEVVKY